MSATSAKIGHCTEVIEGICLNSRKPLKLSACTFLAGDHAILPVSTML